MTLNLARVLGWLVIAHGLSHAVLPMRGSLELVPAGDWMGAALYGISTVGFVAAGLGILGVSPFHRVISPLLVLASGESLVALFVFGDPTLWFGAACDVSLILLGLWRAFVGWPEHPVHHRFWHVAAVTSGLMLVSYVGLAAFTFPANRTWGTTPRELAQSMPGDADERDPALETQHAITIDAPAEDVWDKLEQAFGADVRTAREITPGRALAIDGWGTFVLQPITDEQTRFFIRAAVGDRQRSVWSSAASLLGAQTTHLMRQRQMMLSIKSLAEQGWAVREAEGTARTIDIVASDDMKYSLNTITAEPGEEIRIRLSAKGVIPKVAMAHNVVVLQIDTDIDTLLKEGAPFRETDFIPASMMNKVIAKTSLAGPGERVQVTFTVPKTAGDYPFLCTFAGHYQAGMKGTLIVKSTRMTAVIPRDRPAL